MEIKYDAFNRFEHPKLTLCTAASQYNNGNITSTIGILSATSDEEIVANFNETSTLNFVCHKVPEEDDPDDLYSKLEEKQYIFVDGIGFFCITGINDHVDYNLSYKEISAESCEREIANKTLPASFFSQESNLDYAYNTTFRFDTLIELLVRSLPRWSLARVDDSLSSKYRTFEDVSEDTNILSFMMTEMQDAYECIFVFDIINRYIYAYSYDNYVNMTNIQISNEDVVDSLVISKSSDDIYTALKIVGDNGLNIAGINPIGTSVIYKYDYYIPHMTSALGTKVTQWQNLVASYQDDYYSYATQYYTKLGNLSGYNSELARINTQLDMYKRCRDNVVAASGLTDPTAVCFASTGESSEQVGDIVQEYNTSGTDITITKVFSETISISNNRAALTYGVNSIVGVYIKDSSGVYVETLTSTTDVPVSTGHYFYSQQTQSVLFHTGDYANGTIVGVFYHPSDQSVDEDTIIITDLITTINSDIATLTFDQGTCESNISTTQSDIDAINASMQAIRSAVDISTYFTSSELEELNLFTFEGEYKDDYVTVTDSMTYAQQLEQIEIMYNRALIQLDRVSTPTEQFSLDVENFIFQKDFRDWAEQLQTGCIINVELEHGEIASLFLSNFTVNYEDESLSMTFGNRYTKFDPKTLFDNVLGNVNRTANSISFIKDSIYPITSGEFNEIKRALENIRTLSAGQAITSQYQDFIIDSTGITGKKRSGESGFYPEEIKIVNNMIALTDDSWESCKVAIGKILLNDGTYRYGVNAEVLMGDIILGNEIHILAQDSNGGFSDIFSVIQDRIEAHVPEIHAVTTNTGYTFNDNGLMIERTDSEMVNVLNNEGMEISLVNNSNPESFTEDLQVMGNKLVLTYPAIDVSNNFDISVVIDSSSVPSANLTYDNALHTVTITSPTYNDGEIATVTYYRGAQNAILTAKNDGVATKNLTAHEFLQAGLHSRFENYSNGVDTERTACFYI